MALVKENGTARGLLPLLLLRKLDNKSYLQVQVELRAKIFTDSLQSSKCFNVWGLPNFYLEDGSRAMIEVGKSATPAPKRMLSDSTLGGIITPPVVCAGKKTQTKSSS